MNLQTIGKLAVQMFLDPKGFEEGVEQTTQAAEELKKELEDVAATVNKAVGEAMDGMATKANETAKAVNTMAGVTRDAAGKLRDAQGKFVSGEAAIKALGDTAGLTADEIKQLQDEADKATMGNASKAARSLLASFSVLGDVLGGIVLTGVKAVGVAVAGLGTASTVVGAAFEQQMRQVGVIAGADEEALALLTDEARRLGATTSFSATEAAEAMKLLASAGLDTQQIIAAAGNALVLAGAGGVDLATATSAVTSTLATYNLKAEESARVADVLARATAGSQLEVADLSEALKYGAPTAAAFGYSLEDTVAALAQFRDMGLQGSTAGTALRSVLSQSSQQTKINADTLEKYGLTLQDVNPQLHSFTEVLQTVGNAGINAADAMVVFGVEAGGAFAQMAQQVALGSTKLSDFQTELGAAQGAASAMYGDMQQTVAGAFAELQSAAEEVLLSLFDTYSSVLPGLLNGLTDFVNQVSSAVSERSGEIRGALSNAVETVTAYLRENGDALARSFAAAVVSAADFAQTLAGVATSLAGLIPYLDDIALAMGAIWVASKVAAFASALSNVVTLFGAAQAGLAAFMVELTVSTGGVYALVAAIGVLVAGLVALIARYDEAEESARKLKEAQDALSEKRATATAERAAELDAVLQRQRAAAEAEADALAQAGKLTDEKKRELEILRDMDGLTAARLEAEGKLLLVNDELRTVRQIVQGEDGAALREVSRTIEVLKGKVADTKTEVEALQGAIQRAKAEGLEGGTQQAVFFSSLGLDVTSIEAAEARLQDLNKVREDANNRALNLEKSLNDEIRDLKQEATKDVDDANKARLASTQETAAQAARSEEKEQKKYTDQTRFLYEKLADELAALGATETDQLAIELARREREIRDAYARQIQEAEGNAAEQERLRKDEADTLALLAEYGAQRRAKIEADAEAAAAEKRVQERERVQRVLTGLERDGASEVERLQYEMGDVLAGISEEDADLRARIEQEYLAKIAAARLEEADRMAAQEDAEAKARRQRWVKAARDVADAFSSITSAVGDAVSSGISLVETYLGKLLDLFETVTGFSFDLSGLVGDVQSAQDEAVDEGTTLSNEDAAAQVVEELVAGAVEFATLFADVADDLLTALLAGIPDLITAFVDALPAIAGALAGLVPDIVATLADALPDVVAVLAEQAGVLVAALADALPPLVDALAESMPIVAQALADALPVVVDALLAALPDLFDGLIQAAPILIDALLTEVPRLIIGIIDLLPGMVAAFLDLLPGIITKLVAAVADIVVAIIKALPDLVTAILEALPEIITALIEAVVEALPEIVLALVDALPDVINAVIEAIPAIVLAVVNALPEIITALVALAPEMMRGIAESIPEMLPALLSAMGELIVGLMSSVGEIAGAIWDAIVEGVQSADLVKTLGQTFVDALASAWDAIVETLGDILSAAWDSIVDLFDGGSRSRTATRTSPAAQLGDMLALSRSFGGLAAGFEGLGLGARGGEETGRATGAGSLVVGSSARIAVMFDGRTVQDTLVRSDARGQTSIVSSTQRAGRVVGVSRGKFNFFTR